MSIIQLSFIVRLLLLLVPTSLFASVATPISWQTHSASTFQQAKEQDKYMILDLEAVWCHWCHVMDKTTWQDAKVSQVLKEHYIAIKADHDARPDLAERYREYGWPAIIIYAPDGTEIVKRAGYIDPENMAKLLQAVVRDPSPEDATNEVIAYVNQYVPSDSLVQELIARHEQYTDVEQGGIAVNQKFIDADSLRWDIFQGEQGNKANEKHARFTLNQAMKLIDPVFGGAYQYSTYGDWDHPHYEKIMQTQTRYLQVYAEAYKTYKHAAYRDAVIKIADYMMEFLRDDQGAFYTSQDADLIAGTKSHDYYKMNRSQRLALGIPKIDKHRYAAENGMAIEGLVAAYEITNDEKYLDSVVQATQWVINNRKLNNHGYRHGERDQRASYLSDSMAMARAMFALYELSSDKVWLAQAVKTTQYIDDTFKQLKAGYVSAQDNGTVIKPIAQIDQNISMVDFLLSLYSRTKNIKHLDMAKHGMRFLVTPDIGLSRVTEAGILLLDARFKRV